MSTVEPEPPHPDGGDPQRLERQLRFLMEIDQLKQVLRQSPVLDRSRRENDAEHSWHIAVMALVLAEYAEPEVSPSRAVAMLLVHDLVEIDAGDTFVDDDVAVATQVERELAAADRLFALLPPDQGRQLRALWDEFEARETPDARFAKAMDRLQPMLVNHHTEGGTWADHGVTADRPRARTELIADSAPALGSYAATIIDEALRRGYLAPPA